MSNLKLMKTNGMMNFTLNPQYDQRQNQVGVKFSPCMDIPVSKIKKKHKQNQTRKTILSAAHVQDLMGHVKIEGLQKPIVVTIDKNGVPFVESGHHRLEVFERLRFKYIPAYVAEFVDNVSRLKWLQQENRHPPSLAHGTDDAVKFLQDLKEDGTFEGMTDDEIKSTAFDWLNEFYPHLVGRKKGVIYESYLRGEGKLQHIEHDNRSREAFATKHEFTSAPMSFDRNNNCFFVNADLGNTKKNCASINSYLTAPKDSENPTIIVFTYTKRKTKEKIEAAQKQLVAELRAANNRWIYPVSKVYCIPELLGETECKIFDLTNNM
jgi:hypothetical protein